MTVSFVTDQMTDSQLANYAKLILKVSGIRVSPQKKMLLSNRIRRRLKATGVESFQNYYKLIQSLPVGDPEWDAFLQEITTHETYLFRDENHWDWLRNEYLPEIASAAIKGKRKKELRIWSAACSTGDEAYTIACCIADRLQNHAQWKIEIVGTDIGVGAVQQAREALFGERAMRFVPDDNRRRFFQKPNKDGLWAAKPELKCWTSFQQHNLLDPIKLPAFDLVFLKNVLIYFDDDAKRRTADHLCRQIKPGGILITSATENVAAYLGDLERVSPWIHRKPEKTHLGAGKKGVTQ